MPDHLDAVRQLFRAIVIRSPYEYEIDAKSCRVPLFGAAQHPVFATYTTGQPPLVADLQVRIYDEAYCRPLGTRVEPPATSPASIIEQLSAANAGKPRWESGWTLIQLMPTGQAWARKGTRMQMFAPGHFTAQSATPTAGAPANVFFATESRTEQPGFYIVNGETALPQGTESRMTRIYWDIDEAGAVPLTSAVTTLLNRFEVPFRYKTLSYSGAYTRADSGVLFFPARYHQIVGRLLHAIRGSVRDHLRPATPLLTRKLWDGVGLAEDPANGESFGMHRTRLIAQAIYDAFTRGTQSEESRMQELAIQFERNGLSLDRPHLRAGSADIYAS